MQGLAFDGKDRIVQRSVVPAKVSKEDIELHVGLAGICGTDISAVGKRMPQVASGMILGHEFSATRADTGARVVVNPLLGCRTCNLCTSGRAHICRDRQIVGIHRHGGFAPIVHLPESSLYDASALSDRQAAMVEPLATSLHACRLAGEARRIAIIGAGSIGLGAVFVLRARGMTGVTITDHVAERRHFATEMGARACEGPLEGEFDAVVDCAGTVQAREQAITALAPGGRAVFVGLASVELTIRPGFLISGERMLIGSFGYSREEFSEALVLAKDFDEPWVHEVPFGEGARVFNDLLEGRGNPAHVKTQLRIKN